MVGRSEEEVGSHDIVLLAREHKVELLLVAGEEGEVVVSLDVLEAHDFGSRHISSMGADGELQFAVLQHELLVLAVESLIEEGCGVAFCSGSGLFLLGFQFVLLCDFSLLAQGILYGILLALGSDFLLGWLHVPRIAEKYGCHKDETDDGVLVHFF